MNKIHFNCYLRLKKGGNKGWGWDNMLEWGRSVGRVAGVGVRVSMKNREGR